MTKNTNCSFCAKHIDDVKRLIIGTEVAICNECIDLCVSLIGETEQRQRTKAVVDNVVPTKIKAYLDQYVIGQDAAKKALAVAVFNHLLRVELAEDLIQKTNVMFIGPSGTGKTYMVQCIAKLLNIPVVIADATSMTEAGYVGDDVESCLSLLVQAAEYDLPLAERGIVIIDECDKIAKKSAGVSVTRDVSGEGVQQALLKLVEGSIANVVPKGERKHPQMQTLQISTKNILFIFCGAFDGLQDIIERRLGARQIGFTPQSERVDVADVQIEPEDLIEYGLIPELVGRLPLVVGLKQLTVDDLVKILTQTKGSLISQYQTIFDQYGIELVVTEGAARAIAEKAILRGVNARGLRSIVEKILLECMFNLPGQVDVDRVVLDRHHVENDLQPEIEYRAVVNK